MPTGTIDWRGGWYGTTETGFTGSSLIEYYSMDAVYYDGSSYIATKTVAIGSPPPVADVGATGSWDRLALGGTATGATGIAGSSGSSGTSGEAGTSGSSGSSGTSGESGTSGSSGSSGTSGEAGTSGSSGSSGTSGEAGTSGSSGSSGTSGEAGTSGSSGSSGTSGIGTSGSSGSSGTSGIGTSGSSGSSGTSGTSGFAGICFTSGLTNIAAGLPPSGQTYALPLSDVPSGKTSFIIDSTQGIYDLTDAFAALDIVGQGSIVLTESGGGDTYIYNFSSVTISGGDAIFGTLDFLSATDSASIPDGTYDICLYPFKLAAGSAGTSGSSGSSGTSGTSGSSGSSGTRGTSGSSGSSGTSGSSVTVSAADTEVLYMNSSAVDGDPALTWNYTEKTLYVQGTGSTGPSIRLSRTDASITVNEKLGIIESYNNASGGGASNAGIHFAADATWSGGQYSSRIEFYTVNGTTEIEAMELSRLGKMSLPAYGTGGVSGTVTYNLGVNSAGQVIEGQAALNSRPTATAVTYSIDESIGGYRIYTGGVGATGNSDPQANEIIVGSTDPASVSLIKIHIGSYTYLFNQVLNRYQLENSGTVVLRNNTGADSQYTISSITTASGTYGDFAIVTVTNTVDGVDFVNGATTATNNWDAAWFECDLEPGYNNLSIGNLSDTIKPFAFRVSSPTNVKSGDEIVVEVGMTGRAAQYQYFFDTANFNAGNNAPADWSSGYGLSGAAYPYRKPLVSGAALPLNPGTATHRIFAKFVVWEKSTNEYGLVQSAAEIVEGANFYTAY